MPPIYIRIGGTGAQQKETTPFLSNHVKPSYSEKPRVVGMPNKNR